MFEKEEEKMRGEGQKMRRKDGCEREKKERRGKAEKKDIIITKIDHVMSFSI